MSEEDEVRRQELIELAQLARSSGDVTTELQALEILDSFQPTEQEPPQEQPQTGGLIGEGVGIGETIGSIASGALAEPIGGLAGLAAALVTQDAQLGEQVQQETQEALTLEPRTPEGIRNLQAIGGNAYVQQLGELLTKAQKFGGDFGFDVMQPLEDALGIDNLAEIGGGVGAAIPTALLEAFPALKAPKIASKIPKSIAKKAGQKAQDFTAEANRLKESFSRSGGNLDEAADVIKAANPEDIAELVNADPAFFKAMEQLDINTEPLAAFASKNPQFRDIEGALSVIPGNVLAPQGKAFISAVGEKADNLIQQYGGTLDKAELSDRFRQASLETIDKIGETSGSLYDLVLTPANQATRVQAPSTVRFLNQFAKTQGGIDNLPSNMKNMIEDLTTEGGPTFGKVHFLRKEVGQALGKKSGVFKDAETGLMKKLYSHLREDQNAIADGLGMGVIAKSADGLTIMRKQLEDNLSSLLGKDLKSSISVKSGQALKRLAKGEIEEFDRFIKQIPEGFRSEVVVSSLNDIFKGSGVDQQALSATSFSKIMDDFARQPALKARLYKELPKGAGESLDSLHKISKGISVAMQDKVKTGAVNSLFANKTGFVRKMFGGAASLTAAKVGGPLAGSAVSEVLKQSTGQAKSAGDLIASPAFQSILRESVASGVTDGARVTDKIRKAEKALEKSEKYQRWANTLSESNKAKLLSLGITSYIIDEE